MELFKYCRKFLNFWKYGKLGKQPDKENFKLEN